MYERRISYGSNDLDRSDYSFVVVEIATVGLTSIWFAGGALISLILCLCGVGLGWQIGVFFVVS